MLHMRLKMRDPLFDAVSKGNRDGVRKKRAYRPFCQGPSPASLMESEHERPGSSKMGPVGPGFPFSRQTTVNK